MPSISELIQSKTTRDQTWTEERKAERENLSAMRDAALEEITSNPDSFQKYLNFQSDNMACSVGNVALAMFQMEGATRIGTIQYWHDQGRYVREESMRCGAKVFVPSKNHQQRGYLMGDYYDVTQTTGRPLKEFAPLDKSSPRMDAALTSLMNYAPVTIVEDAAIDSAARYDEIGLTLRVNPQREKGEVFAALATEIAYARIHDKGRNLGFDRGNFRLDAESIGYMVCRRFGVSCEMPKAHYIAQLYEGYEASERGEALEMLRKTARNIGDGIERSLQPRQQERSRPRYAGR